MCMWYCHVATPVRSCEFENKKCANSRPSSRAILADARTANWIWTIPTVAYVSTGWCLIWLDNNKRASSFFPKIQTVAEYRVRVSRAVELFLSSDFEFRGTNSQPYDTVTNRSRDVFVWERVEWCDTDHNEWGVCSNAVRTQLLTSCVRRHVMRYVTHTKFHPESYYFCVAYRSGCFMLITGSRQKVRVPRWCVFWVITEPFFI